MFRLCPNRVARITGNIVLLFLLVLLLQTGCKKGAQSETKMSQAVKGYLMEGESALEKQDWSSAIRAYDKALSESSYNAFALFGRSSAYLSQGWEYYMEAARSLSLAEGERMREQTALADESFAKAEADCRTILAQDEGNVDAHYMIGCIKIYQADWNGALDEFTQVIELKPDYAEAYQRRGEVSGYLGDYVSEASDLKRAAELGYETVSPETDDAEESLF